LAFGSCGLRLGSRYIEIWALRGKKTINIEPNRPVGIVKVHAMVVDALRSMYFPMLRKTKLDKASARYEKTDPPKNEEELKEWNRKRKELFRKGKLKARRARKLEAEDLSQFSDKDLLVKHIGLHSLYKRLKQGQKIPEWSLEEVVKCHVLVTKEMARRGLKHEIEDELDRKSEELAYPEEAVRSGKA